VALFIIETPKALKTDYEKFNPDADF